MYSKVTAVGMVMVGTVSAFSPFLRISSELKSSETTLRMSYENELGVTKPLGFWDPLGLIDGADEATFKNYRAIEIKHGRIAQLAVVGMFVPELIRFPGYLSPSQNLRFADMPNGVEALFALPREGLIQILLFLSFIEIAYPQEEDREPGDIAGKGWVRYEDEEVRADKLNKEINNGRLAMLAISGEIVQNILTGQTPFEQITSMHISPFGDGQGAF